MDAHPIILFDGVCNFCNRSVQFVIERDPQARFRFAALQSPSGQRMLAQLGLQSDALSTVVLVDNGAVYTDSEAALQIVPHLSGRWPLLRFLRFVPRPLRDLVYRQIVRHRYQWWGKRDTCMLPTPELRSRFVE